MTALYEVLLKTLNSGFIPHKPSPKQLSFLLLPDVEAFYGGAAGGGKSDALLMAALMFVHEPSYKAVIFRRTFEELSLPDGLIPRSLEWLGGRTQWNGSSHVHRFPSGASLTFGYLKNPEDHFRYQSSAYHFIGFDEVPQVRENQYRYLFSRLRKLEDEDIPLRIRSAGNPDGPYVKWVKQRFVDSQTAVAPFVPALIDDNPGLDKESYKGSLSFLDPITRGRLLDGNWELRDVGHIFKRSWFTLANKAPYGMVVVRYWDKAATSGGDWTSGVLMGRHEDEYYVLDVKHFRGRPAEVEKVIRQTAILDSERLDVSSYTVVLEQEPGSSGVESVDYYARKVLAGYAFKADRVSGDKASRAAPFSSMAEAGHVKILLGKWDINGYLDELESFPEAEHDDQVDASSGAFKFLASVEEPIVR